jgi:hypothetical protein
MQFDGNVGVYKMECNRVLKCKTMQTVIFVATTIRLHDNQIVRLRVLYSVGAEPL